MCRCSGMNCSESEGNLDSPGREQSKGNRSSHGGARIVFLLAFVLRLGFCAATGTLGRTPESGCREYVMAGERLLQQGAFLSPLILDASRADESALLPPAYVAIVAGVYGLFGVESFAATLMLQLLNAAATSLAASLVFVITKQLAGLKAGWISAAIAMINPVLIGFTGYIWETSLFTLCVVVTVWLSLCLARSTASIRRYVTFGLWLGLAALLNPALTPAYPLFVLYPLSRQHRWRWRPIAAGVAASTLGWLAAITPWTIRNLQRFDELMYVRSGFMLELWLGACPEADAHGAAVYPSQFPLNNSDVQEKVARTGERAFISDCGGKAREAIFGDPLRFGKLMLMRIVDFWAGSTLTHADSDGRVIPRSRGRLAVMFFQLLETGALAAILLFKIRRPEVWKWLLGSIILFSIVYCVTHVQVRYRTPIEPAVAMLIGMVFSRCATTSAGRSNRRSGAPNDYDAS